jgi:hypothetical protein
MASSSVGILIYFGKTLKRADAGELMCSWGESHGAVRWIKLRKTKWRNALGQWF